MRPDPLWKGTWRQPNGFDRVEDLLASFLKLPGSVSESFPQPANG
jgi:hypothetical protein